MNANYVRHKLIENNRGQTTDNMELDWLSGCRIIIVTYH